ncbi:MAG: YihY family inner membrane protein [Rhodospirillaceae bacterium]
MTGLKLGIGGALPRWLWIISVAMGDTLHFCYYTGKRFYFDNYFNMAAAMAYTSLLALVPFMTIVFAIFSAFPAFSRLRAQLQGLLFDNLVPQVGAAVSEYFNRFMENAGQLTAFGIIGLALTAVLLLSTIENAFGVIWRVSEPRTRVIRFLSFWAILTLAPLLFGAGLSLTSVPFLMQAVDRLHQATAPLAQFSMMAPGVCEFFGFTLLYVIVPARSVRWLDASRGGVAAAVLLEVSKAGFVWYLRSFPAYQTIYGALSTVPIFLLWLYVAWCTVLIGAVITATLPEWRAGKLVAHGPGELLPAPRLAVALAVLHELMLASRFGGGARRRTLTDRIPIGSEVIEGILEQLRDADWVDRTTRNTWVVTRDLAEVTLYDLHEALGIGMRGSVRDVVTLNGHWRERCAEMLDAADEAHRNVLGVSLKELLMDAPQLISDGGGAKLALLTADKPIAIVQGPTILSNT